MNFFQMSEKIWLKTLIQLIIQSKSLHSYLTIVYKFHYHSTDNETYRQFLSKSVSSSIYMEPFRVNEVLNIINFLNLNKSVGNDNFITLSS